MSIIDFNSAPSLKPAKTFQVYVASHFPNRLMLQIITNFLESKFPIKFVSSWLYKEMAVSFKVDILKDHDEINQSDFVIAFHPWGDGARSEIAYAVGLNKPVIMVIDNLVLADLNIPPEKYSDFFSLVNFQFINSLGRTKNWPYLIINKVNQIAPAINEIIRILEERKKCEK